MPAAETASRSPDTSAATTLRTSLSPDSPRRTPTRPTATTGPCATPLTLTGWRRLPTSERIRSVVRGYSPLAAELSWRTTTFNSAPRKINHVQSEDGRSLVISHQGRSEHYDRDQLAHLPTARLHRRREGARHRLLPAQRRIHR